MNSPTIEMITDLLLAELEEFVAGSTGGKCQEEMQPFWWGFTIRHKFCMQDVTKAANSLRNRPLKDGRWIDVGNYCAPDPLPEKAIYEELRRDGKLICVEGST
jgi:hypothetical protein